VKDTERPEMTVLAPLSGAYLQTKDVKVSITGTDNIALSQFVANIKDNNGKVVTG
jgi:hypothetical protein